MRPSLVVETVSQSKSLLTRLIEIANQDRLLSVKVIAEAQVRPDPIRDVSFNRPCDPLATTDTQ